MLEAFPPCGRLNVEVDMWKMLVTLVQKQISYRSAGSRVSTTALLLVCTLGPEQNSFQREPDV